MWEATGRFSARVYTRGAQVSLKTAINFTARERLAENSV